MMHKHYCNYLWYSNKELYMYCGYQSSWGGIWLSHHWLHCHLAIIVDVPPIQGRLPLGAELLGECAMNCRAYAKALHYKEEEFHRGVTPKLLESLISINNKLQQPDAAAGVLVYAKEHHQAEFVSLFVWFPVFMCATQLSFHRGYRRSGTRVSMTGSQPWSCTRTSSTYDLMILR